MPFEPAQPIDPRAGEAPPQRFVDQPTMTDVLGAAFSRENSVVSTIQALRNREVFPDEPDHNPLDLVRGTKYEQRYLDRFVGSRSSGETRSIMTQIDNEEADQKILQASGGAGEIMSMIAGNADPTMFIPGLTLAKEAKGLSTLRRSLELGGAFAAQTAVQEGILQGTQETRTPGESAMAIGSATILGGLLGGAFSFLSPAERVKVTRALDRDRMEVDAHARGESPPIAPEPPGLPPHPPEIEAKLNEMQKIRMDALELTQAGKKAEAEPLFKQANAIYEELTPYMLEREAAAAETGGTAMPASAGAAAADDRELKLVSSGIDKVPGIKQVLNRLNPMTRLFRSESVAARRAAADLAETPLLFEENLAGKPTTFGPALDREQRLAVNQGQVAVSDTLSRLFSDYRFGAPDVKAPRIRAQIQDFRGRSDGKLTYDEFKNEIGIAMENGDRHALPQVAEAAQFIRQTVFEPWKKRAIAAGLLPEDVGVRTAESYFSRLYNKELIAARRPDFVEKVTSWLEGDQAAKRQAQERLQAYQNGLDVAQEQIDKITRQIEKLSEDADVIAARQEETTRINKLANRRSEQMRESQFKNEGGVRVDVPGKGIERARGGAVFETAARNRGSELADRVSAKLSQIDELEERLAKEIANHDAVREKIEKEIAAWEGKSVNEAKSALKAREKAQTERASKAASEDKEAPTKHLTGADEAIDRAVKRILKSDRNLSRDELKSRANEITDRILGSPDGRLPYDLHMGGPEIGYNSGEPARGPLAARDFAIPDALIRDYLEKDVEHVVATYLRTMTSDVLLTEKFGDVRMTEAFKKINDDYAALAANAKSDAARTKLETERQNVIRDLAAVRDRVRHVYAIAPDGPMRQAARVVQAVKNYNVLTSMGVAAVSSLPDLAGAVFRHGLMNTFSGAFVPFLRNLTGSSEAYAKAKQQFRAMGIAVETTLAQRHRALNDILDVYKPQTRLERTLQWGADKFQLVNLLAQWTDFAKTSASMVASAEILRACEAMRGGIATPRQLRSLAESGIDATMASRIAESFDKGGQIIDGVRIPNTADWADNEARRIFEGAVARDADIAVITPGQEKPLWLSTPVLSVLGQFKSFTAASTERLLVANLQRRDGQVLQGLLFSMGLGMLSYKINSLTGGQPTSDRPSDWIKESISRGNLMGWFEEGNALASKATRGGLDIYRMIGADRPLSRFAGRSAMDQMLGPTAGKVEALLSVTGGAAKADWKASDTKALRKLTAFQNVFYTRRLFDQVEASGNAHFNIPESPQKPPH